MLTSSGAGRWLLAWSCSGHRGSDGGWALTDVMKWMNMISAGGRWYSPTPLRRLGAKLGVEGGRTLVPVLAIEARMK